MVDLIAAGASGAGGTGLLLWYIVRDNKKKIERIESELKEEIEKEVSAIKDYVNLKHDSVDKKLDGIDKKIDKLFDRIYEIVSNQS